MKKENVVTLKVLTLISGFGLGGIALIGAYLFASLIDLNLNIFELIKSDGILIFIKNIIFSGIVFSGFLYLIIDTRYKLKDYSKTGNVKSSLKLYAIVIIKLIIIAFILDICINIKVELVEVLYVSLMTLILILTFIGYGTKWTVENINEQLEKRKNSKKQ